MLLNDHVEDWFAEALGCDFQTLHQQRHLGVPTVHINCDFTGPSRLGETVDLALRITRLGKASVTLAREIRMAGQVRVRLTQVLTCLNMDTGKATGWPADLEAAMTPFVAPVSDATPPSSEP